MEAYRSALGLHDKPLLQALAHGGESEHHCEVPFESRRSLNSKPLGFAQPCRSNCHIPRVLSKASISTPAPSLFGVRTYYGASKIHVSGFHPSHCNPFISFPASSRQFKFRKSEIIFMFLTHSHCSPESSVP